MLLEAFERYHVWHMITNPALVTTFTHQAHIVVDIRVVKLGEVLLLLLAIRNSNFDAKYLHLVI